MQDKRLPTKLGKEPLVDAVFEIRFSSGISLADILPGVLHSKLGPDLKVERLAIGSLPLELRRSDPDLMNQPSVRVFWKNFIVQIGESTFGVGCVLPYPGWKSFRETIMKMMEIVFEAGVVKEIKRYSVKYVDILELGDSIVSDFINIGIAVGGKELKNQAFQLNMEVSKEPFLQTLQLGSPARAQTIDGKVREGVVVSIDTLCVADLPNLADWMKELQPRLDAIHQQNKTMFFDCLTDKAVAYLEPHYE